MTEQEFKKLINKKQQGLLNKAEEAAFRSFEKKMMAKNSDTIFLNDKHKSKIRQDIYSRINRAKRKTHYSDWMKIASILIIAFTVGSISWYFSNEEKQVDNSGAIVKMLSKEVPFGKKIAFVLPDGSKVKLNSGSTINYPEVFNDSIREVTLSGEAFFEVKDDHLHPFIVKTPSLSTRVLGTSFNIKDYKDENVVAVTLATGKISVGLEGEKDLVLTPSYQVSFNKSNRNFTMKKINLDEFLGWKDGVLRFDNEKLSVAIPKLEKWFNIKIQNKVSADCSFTGVFKDASLESILENITFVKTNLRYKFISNAEIEISGYCNN